MNKKEAILENMIQTFERLSSNSPHSRFIRDENGARMESELPLTVFNRVFDYKFPHADKNATATQMRAIIDSYRERGVKCAWHTYSHMQSDIVNDILLEQDFKAGGTMSGMAVELEGKAIASASLPGLRIVKVQTDEELARFKRVFVAEYGLPDDLARDFTEAFAYDAEGQMQYFLAYLNDLPVGTVMTFRTGEVIGIYMVATLKEFRNKGIGSALVGHALQSIQDQGAKLAVLQASSMGQTIYRSHGFEDELTIHVYG